MTHSRSRYDPLPMVAASLIGLAAFFYPFVLPAIQQTGMSGEAPRAAEAPLVLGLVCVACLALLFSSFKGEGPSFPSTARSVSLLAALVAVDSLLRLVPSIGGASPIFGLMLLVGYVFGPASGFTMGAMTLLVSAAVTGGVGPWLPYQMLAAGWVGLTAGVLGLPRRGSGRIWALAGLAFVCGFAYGALMNLYSWPFFAPGASADAAIYWQPGLSLGETFKGYGAYYLTTSLVYDFFRAVANTLFVIVLGPSLLRLLRRFSDHAQWHPWPDATGAVLPEAPVGSPR